MCGIAGYIDFNTSASIDIIDDMVSSLHHRGPDDRGSEIYQLDEYSIAFGHARLSIIDLTEAGHQPMNYGAYSIVFNGEIYNYSEIKEELIAIGHVFKTHSDTEVILHSYHQWGEKCVERFIGMFSLVILDKLKHELICFVDRAGVKPLYYYYTNEVFVFASELKAFHKHPNFKAEIDLDSVMSFFEYKQHTFIAAPKTIFLNTYKLEQGTMLKFDLKTRLISLSKYWSIEEYYNKPKTSLSYVEAKSELSLILESAFRYRMVSDVPLGVFLSGGYDSTAVVSILQNGMTDKLNTFTIGFEEGNNEAPFAKNIARFVGTNHQELICTSKEAQEIIPLLPYFYDEPFADSSAIPTILVSQLARKNVTVALSADGGDELFGGYSSYRVLNNQLSKMDSVPPFFRKATGQICKYTSNLISNQDSVIKHRLQVLENSFHSSGVLQAFNFINHSSKLPDWYLKNLFVKEVASSKSIDFDKFSLFESTIEFSMSSDYCNYLANDILTKVDRASMTVSLEAREPMLDHRIAEFAAQLPLEFKFDGTTGKKILKDIVHDFVPKSMMDRPKTGFSLPIYRWLQTDLSYLLDEYLNEKSLSESGLFNVGFVFGMVQDFRKDKFYYKPLIWKLLMFQMWYFKWMK